MGGAKISPSGAETSVSLEENGFGAIPRSKQPFAWDEKCFWATSWNLGALGSLVLGAGIGTYRRLESRPWLHAGVWTASSRSKPFWKAFGHLPLTILEVFWRLPGSQIPLKSISEDDTNFQAC